MIFPPIVERLARAFANNHLEHVGGADGDTLVAGTPNWHFFTRDAESAVEVFKTSFPEFVQMLQDEEALRSTPPA